jgi:hypothetical protein
MSLYGCVYKHKNRGRNGKYIHKSQKDVHEWSMHTHACAQKGRHRHSANSEQANLLGSKETKGACFWRTREKSFCPKKGTPPSPSANAYPKSQPSFTSSMAFEFAGQRALATVSASLALCMIALAAWHVQNPSHFELFSVYSPRLFNQMQCCSQADAV